MEVHAPGTARGHVGDHSVTRFHAKVEWYVPNAEGGSYTGWITCPHDHIDEDAAKKCQDRLARRIRTNPHLFADVQHAMNIVNEAAHKADVERRQLAHDKWADETFG